MTFGPQQSIGLIQGANQVGSATVLPGPPRQTAPLPPIESGILDEIRGLLAAGVPPTAHPFTGLVYRQCLEHLGGVRGLRETRDLIVLENRKYSRRQLIWFRKEPNLQWIHAAGERAETFEDVARALTLLEIRPDASVS